MTIPRSTRKALTQVTATERRSDGLICWTKDYNVDYYKKLPAISDKQSHIFEADLTIES